MYENDILTEKLEEMTQIILAEYSEDAEEKEKFSYKLTTLFSQSIGEIMYDIRYKLYLISLIIIMIIFN